MQQKIYFSALAATMALVGSQAQAQNQSADKPNILYIMCDDMGYGDLGCYGQQFIATPNIDRLASEGMLFTQAYAGSPVSAPSRASFMTGQHTGHTHVRGNKEYWRDKLVNNAYGSNAEYSVVGQEPYDANHMIIPELLKKAGYTTGMFGKWAGGYEGSHSTPDKRGIDEYYGFICQFQAHLYYPNFLNRYNPSLGDTEVIRVPLSKNYNHRMYGDDYLNREQYSADLIHQEALKWLDKQEAGKPWLGIFTYTLPHAELAQPHDEILDAYRSQFCECEEKSFGGDEGSRYNPTKIAHAQFAAMITRLDKQVGEIMQKLEEKGMADNTVLIFTSDNGPHEEGGADQSFFNRDGLLQGLKRSTYEGGIRIPFIVRWPSKIQSGTKSDHPFAFYDLMPTFADLAGIDEYEQYFAEGDYLDGISIYPTLVGNGDEQKVHDHLYWELKESNVIGVRKGYWKLVVQNGNVKLFDLAVDLHEDNDISAQYPDVVKELIDIIHAEHVTPDVTDFEIALPAKR